MKRETDPMMRRGSDDLSAADNEPPVVARLVVEIRSDGTRTIARGGLEDLTSGERVAIRAEGATPMQLVLSLGKAILSAPAMVRTAARALLK